MEDFQNATGQDSNSYFVNPYLGDGNNFFAFFSLNDNSPAINNGYIHQYIGEWDALGNKRISDYYVDIGAIEIE